MANEELCCSIRVLTFHKFSVCECGGNVDRKDRVFKS